MGVEASESCEGNSQEPPPQVEVGVLMEVLIGSSVEEVDVGGIAVTGAGTLPCSSDWAENDFAAAGF